MKRFARLWAVLGLLISTAAMADDPPLNANGWNIVLVPSFEQGRHNNLSVAGLNASLRFGQTLTSATAGKLPQVRQVYALTLASPGKDTDTDMVPLQSIQPYALLNYQAVKVQQLNPGGVSTYNSPAYFMQQLLANQPRGIYVIAMPRDMLAGIAENLTGSLPSLDAHHYYVVSGQPGALKLDAYADGVTRDAKYPEIALPRRSATCPQAPVTIRVRAPDGLLPYISQKALLVRHVEAHPGGNFENGNYVCQGQWRALGANRILLEKLGRRPDYVYTSDPADIIDCGQACSYIRPSLTVAPFAIQHDLPLTPAPFQWEDAADLAIALFDRNSPYLQRPASGQTLLVGWEHDHIEKAVRYLLANVYRDPAAAARLPSWSYTDYDTVWELSTDEDGTLTFRNSCEGIATNTLPSTCPAFFP
ncbi:MAG: hypothetical protein M3Q42_02285 [Pseudomonadota bacterium]|nr:hypothetical protein [Pseudomonadota bacterium]